MNHPEIRDEQPKRVEVAPRPRLLSEVALSTDDVTEDAQRTHETEEYYH